MSRLGQPVVLSGFQRYFCMLYTTYIACSLPCCLLFYQDFKDTFVCNTQPHRLALSMLRGCFIRISKNNLLQKYKKHMKYANLYENILLFQKTPPLHQLNLMTYTIRIIPLCKHSEWHASVALFYSLPNRLIA